MKESNLLLLVLFIIILLYNIFWLVKYKPAYIELLKEKDYIILTFILTGIVALILAMLL